MLKEAVTITTDTNLIAQVLEESTQIEMQVCPDFIVRLLRHPTEGLLCLTVGSLTDYAVITKVAE